MKQITAKKIRVWYADYSTSASGNCIACGKPMNGRDTHIRHAVTVYDIDGLEVEICDRHIHPNRALTSVYNYGRDDLDCVKIVVSKKDGKK